MPSKVPHSLYSLALDPPARVDNYPWRQCVYEAIHLLPNRLAQVVILKYYGEDGEPWTLTQIGKRMGVSDERIRQLLNKAYSQLEPIFRQAFQN